MKQLKILLRIIFIAYMLPLMILATESNVTTTSIGLGQYKGAEFNFPSGSPSIHSPDSNAHYFTLTLMEAEDIRISAYADVVDSFPLITANLNIYLIEGTDPNASVIAENIDGSSFIVKSLSAGTYTIEVANTDNNLSSVGYVSAVIYEEPTPWSRLDYKDELFMEPLRISDQYLSLHREGSYASYYTLIIKENAYITIGAALFDFNNIEIQTDSYVYLIKGSHENGEVISEGIGGVTEILEAGKYTIEVTTKEPAITMSGDILLMPALPVNIITDMILQD